MALLCLHQVPPVNSIPWQVLFHCSVHQWLSPENMPLSHIMLHSSIPSDRLTMAEPEGHLSGFGAANAEASTGSVDKLLPPPLASATATATRFA